MTSNMLMPLAAAGLGFIAVMLLVMSVSSLLQDRGRSSKVRGRLGVSPDNANNLSATIATGAQHLGEKLGPKTAEEHAEQASVMIKAGYRNPNAAKIFFGVKAGLALSMILLMATIRFGLGFKMSMTATGLLFVVPAMLGMYVPEFWIRSKAKSRRMEILHALPDALDMLVVCVEAGMGLDQALSRVTNEIMLTSPTLSEELNIVILELRAGKTRAEALRNLSKRVELEDVNSLVSLIIQADSFGTSIARTLRVYSDSLRTKRYQRAEEMAAKMPVKLLFPLVFCILPALLVAIMGPAGLKMMKTFAAIQ